MDRPIRATGGLKAPASLEGGEGHAADSIGARAAMGGDIGATSYNLQGGGHVRPTGAMLSPLAGREQALFDVAPVALLVTSPEGFVRHVNRAAGVLLGRLRGDLLAKSLRHLVPAEEQGSLMSGLGGAWAAGETRELVVGIGSSRTACTYVAATVVAEFDMGGKVAALHWALRKASPSPAKAAESVRRRDELMRRRQQELSDFLHDGPVGVQYVGADGSVLHANDAQLAMVGRTWREYVDRPATEFHCDRAAADALMAGLARGEAVRNREATLRHADGSVTHVLIDARVLWQDGAFVHSCWFTRDVTAQKVAEEAARKEAEFLTEVLEAIDSLVVVADRQGRIVYINGACQRHTGFGQADVMGQCFWEFLPPAEEADAARQRFASAVRDASGAGEVVGHWRTKHGVPRTVAWSVRVVRDADGAAEHVILTGTDVTEHEQAQAASVRLASIVDSSCDAIIGIGADGRIQTWNGGAARMYGYTAAEMRGQPVSMLSPQHAPGVVDDLVDALAAADPGGDHQARTVGLRKDGRLIDVLRVWSPVLDADGGMAGFSVIDRDTTEQNRLEREILRISEREQRRIGQDLHDDLCQHLAGVACMGGSLAHRLQGPAPAEAKILNTIVEMIQQGIARARDLARGLHPAQLRSDGLPTALRKLAEGTSSVFGVSCQFECGGLTQRRRAGTAVHLYRIAQEAISNAIRHGKAKEIKVSLTERDGMILLDVVDDGSGIKPATIGPAPRPGLGLSIMRSRARMIDAEISVGPGVAAGTIVSVRCRGRAVQRAGHT